MRSVLITIVVLAAAPAALAQPTTLTDGTPGVGTIDGTIGPGEYPASSTGVGDGFGGPLGDGLLYVDMSAGGDLHLGLAPGAALNDAIVIYLDTRPGGFASTTPLTDVGDTLRTAISGGTGGTVAPLTFASGFEADFAIALHPTASGGSPFAGLWELKADEPHVFLSASFAVDAHWEIGMALSTLGLSPGDSFRLVATLLNPDTAFRSDELHGVAAGTVTGNPGNAPVALADGDFNTVEAAPWVIAVDSLDDLLAGDGNCTLREAVQTANAGASVDSCPGGLGRPVIEIPAGTILLSLEGSGEDASATGDLDLLADMTIRGVPGPGSLATRVEGVLDRIFDVHGADVVLESLDLVHGGGTNAGLVLRQSGGQIELRAVRARDDDGLLDTTAPGVLITGAGAAARIAQSSIELGAPALRVEDASDVLVINTSIEAGLEVAVLADGAQVGISHSTIASLASGVLSTEAGGIIAIRSSVVGPGSCDPLADIDDQGFNYGDGCNFQEGVAGFQGFEDHGGPTPTRLPDTGSATLDGGACTDVLGQPVVVDQRGLSRPFGAGCDAGAVEAAYAVLSLDVTDDIDPAEVAETVTYTVQVGADSPTDDVVVEVALPPGASFVAANSSGGCAEDEGRVTCTVGTVSPGPTTQRQVALSFGEPGLVELTFEAFSGTLLLEAPEAVETTGVGPGTSADLQLALSAEPTPAPAGGIITWQGAVHNAGPDDADGVAVVFELPPEVSGIDAPGCGVSGPTVTCPVGTVTSGTGASATVSAVVDAPPGADLPASATVSAAAAEANPGDEQDSTLTPVAAPEDCANGIDDNGNGADCADPQCTGDAFCDPCSQYWVLTSGPGAWQTDDPGLWEYVRDGADGLWATGGLGDIPPGKQTGRLNLEVAVPPVAAGGPRPRLEVVYQLHGDPNPSFDVFAVCIDDPDCEGNTAGNAFTMGINTAPGEAPGGLPAPAFNDGVWDHVFVDLSGHTGETITVTLLFDTVTSSGGGDVDGLRITEVTLASDVDRDGDLEGTAPGCDACWDGDLDSFLHRDSPGLGGPACGGASPIPDCDDTRSDVNPEAAEVCGDLAGDDEDCDGEVNAFDLDDCGPEDCADGEDNNDDGAVDCADPTCAGDAFCEPCGTRFSFATGGGGWDATTNVGEPVFEHGTSADHGGEIGWSTVRDGLVSAVAAGAGPTRAWLSRQVAVPSGTPRQALEIVYALDGDPAGGRDVLGVCFDTLVSQCTAAAPPGLIAFETDVNTGTTLTSQVIPFPESKVGQTVDVIVFYDTVDEADNANRGVFIDALRVASDLDGDGFYEAADPLCDHCVDADDDGFGAEGVSPSFVATCEQTLRDCDDQAPLTHPGGAEICDVDGDQNCDGLLDHEDQACSECGDLQVTAGETCDDGDQEPGDGCDEACQVEPGALHVTEVHLTRLAPNAPGEQWFEIYNRSGAAVDLAQLGLSFVRETGASQSFLTDCSPVGGASTSVGPGGYYVIALGLIGTADGLPADAECSGSFQLDPTGDVLRLQASGGAEIDAVDFRSFGCEVTQDQLSGKGRSLELADPANQTNASNDGAAAWCLAGGPVSYATSGNHLGSPGGPGSCGELVCEGVDDDCDGETDEGLPDTDADGLCDGVDCDADVGTCTTDCGTDVDEDGIPDCRDGCLDADADGWGVPGGAAVATCNTQGGAPTPDCDDNLSFVNPAATEGGATCTNQVDDDCDGLPDCADDACGGIAACEGEACAGAAPVSCGVLNVVEPFTDELSCGDGNDAVLQFVPTSSETVTVEVANEGTAQYSVNVFAGACENLSCDGASATIPSSCQGGGQGTFEAVAGTTYFLVVDQVGACGGEGSTEGTVRVRCGEVCGSGADEDGDGKADCADGDCVAEPACAGGDLDQDLASNGDELICGTDPLDPFQKPSADDVKDVDDDQLLNCVDPNDDNDPFADADEVGCPAGAKSSATIYPGAPKACQQPGLDADCNGVEDASEDQCGAAEQQCGDGDDNDSDGQVDCVDPDCIPAPVCGDEDFDDDGVPNRLELACNFDAADQNQTPGPQLVADPDGDLVPNCADGDDDGDGFDDLQEVICGSDPLAAATVPADTDGDDQCDAADTDDDGDGFDDQVELDCGSNPLDGGSLPTDPALDLDQDGTCDARDPDVDGDGWTDSVEDACGTDSQDAANNPSAVGFDVDEDGKCDALDADDDDDGWSDDKEALCQTNKSDPLSVPTDVDGDGVCDIFDQDADGDDWPDQLEVQCGTLPGDAQSNPTVVGSDQDGDKLCDPLDDDDDGDGWADEAEAECGTQSGDPASVPPDIDGDLLCDAKDDDDDGDGWLDATESLCSSDPKDAGSMPADADGDGVCDNVDPEADPDGDGWTNFQELTCGSLPKDAQSVPVDTDADGACDEIDDDDDGDGWIDLAEAQCGSNALAGDSKPVDTDGDGTCDAVDTDDDGDGAPDSDEELCGTDPLDETEHPLAIDLADLDGDEQVNCVDPDDDGDDVTDADEAAIGSDPHLVDTDGDGLNDGFENADLDGEIDPGETDPTTPDTDADGLDDGLESTACYLGSGPTCEGSDPLVADTDGDGLSDSFEDGDADGAKDGAETNPLVADTDGDGFSDGEEVECATHPLDAASQPVDKDEDGTCDGAQVDSDLDGVADGVETVCGTDPDDAESTPALAELEDADGDGDINCKDTDDDGDGVSDADEITCQRDPLSADDTPTTQELGDFDMDQVMNCADPDDDDDGLPDADETVTDPLDADTDDDGIPDGKEVLVYFTDPTRQDTDGDGITDGVEVGVAEPGPGTDPDAFVPDLDPTTTTNPKSTDTDDDLVPDGEEDANHNGRVDEEENEGDPSDPSDGLADDDGDGLTNRQEKVLDTDPGKPDTDDDGLNDKIEVEVYETDPLDPDTDDGGIVDGIEVENGTDPHDPSDDFDPAEVVGDTVFGCTTGGRGAPASLWLVLAALALLAFRRRAWLVLLIGVTALPQAADAQVNAENFFPVGGRHRVFAVEQSLVGPKWQPYAHVLFHGERESLKVRLQGTDHDEVLVASHVFADLNLGVGLFDVVQLEVGLPIALQMETGDNVSAVAPASGAGIGDLVVRVRATAIDNRDGGFGLGFSAGMTAPTGDGDHFRGDPGVGVLAGVIADYRHRWVTVALNAGVRIRTEEAVLVGRAFGHELTYGLGVDVTAWPDYVTIGLETFGRTPLLDPFGSFDSTALELLGGPKWWIIPNLALQVAAGAGLVQGVGTPDFRFLAGLVWAPREVDTDGDGLDDRDDRCPYEAEDADGYADGDGCPDADNDGDGVADADDRCPMTAGEGETGCPQSADADQDGVPDAQDRCPSEPEDVDRHEDDDGCPDPDNDGDGLPDAQDTCPNLAETKNGFQDEDGCPDEPGGKPGDIRTVVKTVKVGADPGCLLEVAETATFPSGGVILDDAARQALQRIATQVKARLGAADKPPVIEIAVRGHTRDEGDEVEGLRLSRERAMVARDYLVSLGIPRGKAPARGMGSAYPAETGESRRVDVVVSIGGKCLEVK